METKVITSLKGVLAARDYLKGLGLAMASAAFYALCDILFAILKDNAPLLDSIKGINLDTLIRIAIGAGLTYLGKNKFFDNPKVVTVLQTNEDARTAATDIKKTVQ